MAVDRSLIAVALPAYEIRGEVGRGAFGVVLEGWHRNLERRVAIKQLAQAFGNDKTIRRRFLAEAKMLAQLEHPHVVEVYDFVEHEGVCLLVMELLPGGTVWDRATSSGLQPEEACALTIAAAAGLDHAHQLGMLHRDVKPENLVFSERGVVKLTDFGLSKMLGGSRTMATAAGEVLGSPAYLSPEQALGKELTPATDVYSTGTMLYEMLAGRLPFSEDGDALALISRRIREQPVPLGDVASVDGEVAAVVMRALATDPADRWPTAAAFGSALAQAATRAFGRGWITKSTVPVMGAEDLIGRTGASGEVDRGQLHAKRASIIAAPSQVRAAARLPSGGVALVPLDEVIEDTSRGTMAGVRREAVAPPTIELHEAGRPPRRLAVTRSMVIGREGDVVLVDPEVSRRHVRVAPSGNAVVLTDLNSTNGTFVNGERLSGEVTLGPGQRVELGATWLALVGEDDHAPFVPVAASEAEVEPAVYDDDTLASPIIPPDARAEGSGGAAAAPRPEVAALASRDVGAAVVRYREGSIGARAAKAYGAGLRRARKKLAGFGSEPWGVKPQVCLVDPFPDPSGSGAVVTDGAVVDADRNEIWVVVTSESPPEPPERALAVFFGSSLPAADEMAVVIEGYGLHLADAPRADEWLAEQPMPPLDQAEGELRSAMAVSFVRFLIERVGEREVVRLMTSSRPGNVDATAQEIMGASLPSLEQSWLMKLYMGGPKVPATTFMKLSWKYARPYRMRELEIFGLSLLSLAFTTTFPFLSKRLFDDALPSGKMSEVNSALLIMGVALAISIVAGLRRTYVAARVSSGVTRDLRNEMFTRLQHLDTRWYDQHHQGDVLSRILGDVPGLEHGITAVLRDGVFQTLSLLVASVVLLKLNLFLGFIVIISAPVIAVVYRLMAGGAQKRAIAVEEQTGVVASVATENFAAHQVVKAFGAEQRETSRFGQATQRLFQNEVRMSLFTGLFGVAINSVMSISRLVVLGLGCWLIIEAHLTFGELVAFLGLMGEVVQPVMSLSETGRSVQSALGSLVRVNEILETPSEIPDEPGAPPIGRLRSEIAIQGVTFSYSPERTALRQVDAVIPAGTRAAFVGPSGSGKSSLLQLIMRNYDPDEGAIVIDGTDIRSVSLASLRTMFGVVHQDTFLFEGTIRENLVLGKPNATDAEVVAAAKAAELDDFLSALPRGYDTVVGERGVGLSGGQRQRLAIARALLRDPQVLLLDEATSALDPRTERLVSKTIKNLAKGRTVVAVTHRLASVVDYDIVFVVVDGEIRESGTYEELMARGEVFAALWNEQHGQLEDHPSFDPIDALRRLPLFAGADAAELGEIAARLEPIRAEPGERFSDGGAILFVRDGRAKVLRPQLDGSSTVVAELGPGDAFGLGAALGGETGTVLEAVTGVGLLALGGDLLAAAAARMPDVDAALTGAAGPRPAGGRSLARASFLAPMSMADHDARLALRQSRLQSQRNLDVRASGSLRVVER